MSTIVPDRIRAIRSLELSLFLTLWFVYGILINSRNLEAFGLQQAGVEAYVERHHFFLEGSQVPRLQVQPVVDAFIHDGHVYPAKQPGQFLLGACAYFPLHALGLTYSSDYLFTSALVTFLTASLVTAASAVAVFRTARLFAPASCLLFWPLLVAVSYALGTSMLAYSGIAWHDTLATGFLAIGCYLVVTLSRSPADGKRLPVFAATAGFFLALTITTSMLPLSMAALAIAFGAMRHPRIIPALLGGAIAGLAPLLVYNFACFGNPFLVSNIAGNYSDTFIHPSWPNFLGKVAFYRHMTTLYVPVAWFGIAGLLLFPAAVRREQALFATMLVALLATILNIEANGTCQYGPRYLLPAMPVMSLGLIGFGFIRARLFRRAVGLAVAVCALVSFLINLVGALHGAMLCDFTDSAVVPYISQMWRGQTGAYPLAIWLFLPLFLSAAWFIYTLMALRRNQPSAG